MADDGISVTSCSVSHQQPCIDKLIGEERIVLVRKSDAAFHGPGRRVNLVIKRQQLSTCNLRLRGAVVGIDGQRGSLAQACTTWPRLSSGMVKITVIGSNCVITARVTVPADCTTLPGSTNRRPTRPEMGAVMWQKSS